MTVRFLSWCELLNDWQSLGLALGLLYPTLERIEEEQRGAIEKYVQDKDVSGLATAP